MNRCVTELAGETHVSFENNSECVPFSFQGLKEITQASAEFLCRCVWSYRAQRKVMQGSSEVLKLICLLKRVTRPPDMVDVS